MKITLQANPADAPCCVKIIAEDGQERLIQTDWDFCGVASTFGWSPVYFQAPGRGYSNDYYRPTCRHEHTDGTVSCADCGATPTDFILSARTWIDEHDGATTDDPGYFETANH